MSTRVTITLPDDIYQRARRLAQLTNRDLSEVVADTLESSLLPLTPSSEAIVPVESLSDAEVLQLTDLQMSARQDRRMSKLLQKQQEDELLPSERTELFALLQIYHEGVLRKAQALREAVQRGLRPPLES